MSQFDISGKKSFGKKFSGKKSNQKFNSRKNRVDVTRKVIPDPNCLIKTWEKELSQVGVENDKIVKADSISSLLHNLIAKRLGEYNGTCLQPFKTFGLNDQRIKESLFYDNDLIDVYKNKFPDTWENNKSVYSVEPVKILEGYGVEHEVLPDGRVKIGNDFYDNQITLESLRVTTFDSNYPPDDKVNADNFHERAFTFPYVKAFIDEHKRENGKINSQALKVSIRELLVGSNIKEAFIAGILHEPEISKINSSKAPNRCANVFTVVKQGIPVAGVVKNITFLRVKRHGKVYVIPLAMRCKVCKDFTIEICNIENEDDDRVPTPTQNIMFIDTPVEHKINGKTVYLCNRWILAPRQFINFYHLFTEGITSPKLSNVLKLKEDPTVDEIISALFNTNVLTTSTQIKRLIKALILGEEINPDEFIKYSTTYNSYQHDGTEYPFYYLFLVMIAIVGVYPRYDNLPVKANVNARDQLLNCGWIAWDTNTPISDICKLFGIYEEFSSLYSEDVIDQLDKDASWFDEIENVQKRIDERRHTLEKLHEAKQKNLSSNTNSYSNRRNNNSNYKRNNNSNYKRNNNSNYKRNNYKRRPNNNNSSSNSGQTDPK